MSNLQESIAIRQHREQSPNGIVLQPYDYTSAMICDLKKLGSNWVKANTGEQQKVLVAGFGAQVQVYSERLSPSIYFNVTQTETAKKRLLFEDLKQNKPTMILVPLYDDYRKTVNPDIRLFIDSLVAKGYRLSGCMCNYNIYRIK